MDRDLAARLDRIDKTIGNLAAAMALVARHQTTQGETLAAIVELLTPKPKDPDQPTLPELLEQLMRAQETTAQVITQRLVALGHAVRNLPLDTAQAIHDNLGPLAKEKP